MNVITIYKGKLSEVLDQIKKDIENETKENKDMADN